MLIRPATPDDLDRLTEMAADFYARTGYAAHMDFDAEATRQSLGALLSLDTVVVLIVEVGGQVIGGTGGMAVAPIFSTAEVVQELFWYVDPAHRGIAGPALFKALRDWARERGSPVMAIASVDASEGERVGRLYRRMGFVQAERSYIGRV